ncbi:MAG: ABC transporter ATP-binding protein [Candidatus Koribacter versatilis]|uniref:ABC transporter ATP-binding protein n=1 Tax=Candidatus Korobacter versatilis TaxID=658062 RepID=A0A932A7W3_9BACT|nr:ABC transporter ATP-binding protein [Candidatus Koribacter versatilis]
MALLEVRDLVKVYPASDSVFAPAARAGSANAIRAVDGVSFDIARGETLGLVGESGCGKTTLGRAILRLIEPTSGSVRFEDNDVLTTSGGELRRLRRDMQIVFQDPFSSLDPRMRVQQIVTEPLVIHHDGTRVTRAEKARELMRAVDLDESALARYPHEFSGGQRQRIVIARALALRPKFIVCDEPVSALDVSVGAQIVNLLRGLQRDFGLTYLFISHSMPVVRYLSTRIAVMHAGKIVELGTTEQITERPQHEYTRTLLAATPEVSVQ